MWRRASVPIPVVPRPVIAMGQTWAVHGCDPTTRRPALATVLRPDAAGIRTAVRIRRDGGVLGLAPPTRDRRRVAESPASGTTPGHKEPDAGLTLRMPINSG
jgi:hypothetical protein